MSGGYFDYEQYIIRKIADSVEHLIRSNNDMTPNDYEEPIGRNYSSQTIERFKEGFRILRIAEIFAQRIDWLVSCDDSEETFHSRLLEDLEIFTATLPKKNDCEGKEYEEQNG